MRLLRARALPSQASVGLRRVKVKKASVGLVSDLLAFSRGGRRPPDRWDDVVPVGRQGLVLRIVLELEAAAGGGPFCGANARAGSSNATTHRTRPQAQGLPSRRPRRRRARVDHHPVVALPPTAARTLRAPEVEPPAEARQRRAWSRLGVARIGGRQRQTTRLSRFDHRRSAIQRPSPPSATGARSASTPAAATPALIARAASAAENVALDESGQPELPM